MVVVLKGSWSVQIKKFLEHKMYDTHSIMGKGGGDGEGMPIG